jgi:L-ribulose-5-phosphate 3-epimerase
MTSTFSRRRFLQTTGGMALAAALPAATGPSLFAAQKEPLFKVSLAQWSLNKALFGRKMDNLDFAKSAKNDFGIDAVEYVNHFFKVIA